MTTPDFASPPDRVLVVGPRELDVLRLLWEHGPATVRQLHTWLIAEPPIAYSTLQTICLHLTTKGVLRRRSATELPGHPYIFEPTIGPAMFRHVMVGRTRRLIAPYPTDEIAAAPPHTEREGRGEDVHEMLAALRERVAAAEHAAMLWESTAHRAERRIEALERRAQAAERRAETAERGLKTLKEQLNRPPRPTPTPRPPREIIIEHRDPAGICRVCAAPAPPPYKSRTDGLRVCVAESCRQEARRRDNLAKQHRYNARQCVRKAQSLDHVDKQ